MWIHQVGPRAPFQDFFPPLLTLGISLIFLLPLSVILLRVFFFFLGNLRSAFLLTFLSQGFKDHWVSSFRTQSFGFLTLTIRVTCPGHLPACFRISGYLHWIRCPCPWGSFTGHPGSFTAARCFLLRLDRSCPQLAQNPGRGSFHLFLLRSARFPWHHSAFLSRFCFRFVEALPPHVTAVFKICGFGHVPPIPFCIDTPMRQIVLPALQPWTVSDDFWTPPPNPSFYRSTCFGQFRSTQPPLPGTLF